jgi:hypothetical protein
VHIAQTFAKTFALVENLLQLLEIAYAQRDYTLVHNNSESVVISIKKKQERVVMR